ncbi:MAG: hypothetical protein HYY18_19870 [Planctomycetes bacterium]|nr:hypothetical protein [Planctomycetota bacterium]
MNLTLRPALCALLFLASTLTAAADKVTLKDGRVYEGAVVEENDKSVKIRTARATLTFPRDQVASIERTSSPLQERESRLEALDPKEPVKYVETAEWMLDAGDEAFELETFRRLCNIAAFLDRKLACRANKVLATGYGRSKRLEEAAEAWARAAVADPADAKAKQGAEESKRDREAAAKRRLSDLRDAIALAATGDIEGAIPKLRATKNAPLEGEVRNWLKVPVDDLIRDLQRRVPCKPCGGTGQSACSLCKGTGLIECSACGGDGKKSLAAPGQGGLSYTNTLCRTCNGIGNVLCTNCKAERDVRLTFGDKTVDGNRVPDDEIVHCVAGKEKDNLRPSLNFRDYSRVSDGKYLTKIAVAAPSPGGTRNCGTCGGVKFERDATPPDYEAMKACVSGIDAWVNAGKPVLKEGFVNELFDTDVRDDGDFYYVKGRWQSGK